MKFFLFLVTLALGALPARAIVGGANAPAALSAQTVMIVSTRGLPAVSVPVLSTTTVSTFSSASSASALRIRTPACAPRPVPTMIDMGVASPSAHGHAMINTATAFTRACASRGSGPNSAQSPNVRIEIRITEGTNQPETRSASF